MDFKISECKKALKTKAIASLENDRQRAAALIELGHTYRTVAAVLGLSVSSVQAAVKCKKEYGPPTGKRGRRPLLNTEERSLLVEAVEESRKKSGIDMRKSQALDVAKKLMISMREPNFRKDLSENWFSHYIHNDPDLSVVTPRSVEDVCIISSCVSRC